MAAPLLHRIDTQLNTFSPAERRVADWVLANPRRSVELSIAELAAAADVSEPTVIRFCRSLGISGYREFKTTLIANLHRPENYLHHDVSQDDSATDAAGKVLDSTIRALVDLRHHTAGMPFAEAVKALAGCRQILFVGIGASGHVATDAQHKFFRLGKPCSAATDAHTIRQSAAIAGARDAFVAISNSGTWPELVDSMRDARERGATVLALTEPTAPLAKAAQLTFPCHAPEDTNVFTPMSSRLCHLAVLDALQVALALALGASAEAKLRLSKAALQQQASAEGTPA